MMSFEANQKLGMKFRLHAYPHETGAEAVKILFYDGFQYVAIFLTGFVLFSSNLLKNH